MTAMNHAPRIEQPVFDIDKHLKPHRNGYSKNERLGHIHEMIKLLNEVVPQFYAREAVRRTRNDAKAIRAAVVQLERQIKNASPEMRLRLKPPLLASLQPLRTECDAAIKAAPPTDKVKEWCARTALHLIVKFSDRAPASSEISPYRKITGLLYQAITGEADRDFKRACDNLLRLINSTIHTPE